MSNSAPLVQPRDLQFTATGNLYEDAKREHGLAHERATSFPIGKWSIAELEELGGTVQSSAGPAGSPRPSLVLSFPERAVASWSAGHGMASISVAAHTADVANEICLRVSDRLRDRATPEPDLRVPVYFWLLGPHGPEPIRRKID